MLSKFAVVLGFLGLSALLCEARDLEIYWIDAEGGASTLIVSPSGESLPVDTANRTPDDRDANEKMIANMEPTAECKGNLLKVTVASNGKFTVTNERNRYRKTYQAQ
jgi:hypothetical protein